ncbi:MAG: hypothetical protein U0R24_07560 [Solirubrobacterales bacterium]
MSRRKRRDEDRESEELARKRRERARRARGGLAAKAAGEDAEEEAGDDGPAASGEEPEGGDTKAAGRSKGDRDRAAQRKKLTASAEKPAGAGAAKKDASDEERPRSRTKRSEERRTSKPSEAKRSEDSKKPAAAERKGDSKKPVAAKRDASKPARKRDSSKPSRKRGEHGGAKRAGKRAKRLGAGAGTALKRGAVETRARATKAAPKVASGLLGVLATGFALLFTALGFVLSGLIAVYRFLEGPVGAALRATRRAIDAVSRQVTPVRVLALVVAGAAILLALSQFAVYRSVSIGNDAYAEGIQTVAPAPIAETADTGSAHSYLMVPLAAVALVLLGAALTGRWRLCRLIALAGLIAIAVGLIHDRPTGLDPGQEAVAYVGVEATLLGGFYAQLFSGLLLTLSSLLLGRELRLAGASRPARASRGSRAGRRLLRRDPRVEGARA